MLRTLRLKFRRDKEHQRVLDHMSFVCTKLWNTANWERRDQWGKTGEIPSYADQCTSLKENKWYKLLHSQSAQGILQKLAFAYKSWYKLHKKDPRARPPGFRPKTMKSTILYKQAGFKVEGNKIRLALSARLREALGYQEQFLWLSFKTHIKPSGTPKTLEIKRIDGEWVGFLVEELAPPKIHIPPRPKALAIDQGIINLASCIDTDGNTTLYTGKGLLSIQRYFNKQTSTVQHRVQKRKGKYAWTAGLTAMFKKRRFQPNHALHALTKQIVRDCIANNIQVIVLGDLKHIRKDKDTGDKTNQKLHAWSFQKFATLLAYKAEAAGILVELVSERNTSKTCSVCRKKGSRKPRGMFKCTNKKCTEYGKLVNADLNGARGILNRYLRMGLTARKVLVGNLACPKVRYWNWHNWSDQKWSIRQSGDRVNPVLSDLKPAIPQVESPQLYSTSSLRGEDVNAKQVFKN
ncbi:MAG: RNA-guided endonuclease InsQ/TnpB family protein [Candidatus Hermodarchaeota archaeon]